jgi:hypothetical protein
MYTVKNRQDYLDEFRGVENLCVEIGVMKNAAIFLVHKSTKLQWCFYSVGCNIFLLIKEKQEERNV